MTTALRPAAPDRRLAGIALTVLVHAGLIVAWQAARRSLPEPQGAPRGIQWILLPASVPQPQPQPRAREPERLREREPVRAQAPRSRRAMPPVVAPFVPAAVQGAATALPSASPSSTPSNSAITGAAPPAGMPGLDPPAATGAEGILQRARRDIGKIDQALRKENKAYIAAPLDSPQIRMQRGIEQAAALAPNRLWEAPKVEELVNNTGDGARRSRVITGNGTYCITDRATNTSIDMIEKHGKQRFTSCPEHEEPSRQQTWRTLRD